MEVHKSINSYSPTEKLSQPAWMDQSLAFLSSAQLELRAGLDWIFELGISTDMPFYQQKNLALINRVSFLSLLLAFPGTFLLILIGFSHPLGILFSGMLCASLVLAFNGANRTQWSKVVFAFSPACLTLIFSLLELASGVPNPTGYILARQGICFSLLLPILVFGWEERQKVVRVGAMSVLLFLAFEVASMRLGAFKQVELSGIQHGIFSLLSLVQYVTIGGCILYVQNYMVKNDLQKRQANQKLNHLAIRDGLTGLFNHAFTEQLITDAINRTKRSGTPLSLLMIDVDSFKQVNDTFGHSMGDQVLKELTQVLKSSTRSTDYLGRWGGDELLLLLTDTSLPGAANLAEKLRSLVEGHIFSNGQPLSISLGACQYQETDSTQSFIDRADACLYRAKRGGRNRLDVCN